LASEIRRLNTTNNRWAKKRSSMFGATNKRRAKKHVCLALEIKDGCKLYILTNILEKYNILGDKRSQIISYFKRTISMFSTGFCYRVDGTFHRNSVRLGSTRKLQSGEFETGRPVCLHH